MSRSPPELRLAASAASATSAAESAEQVLRRLEWTVLRRLDGLLQGHHRTLMRGNGMDLADLREYQLHDDVRHMDWNVTARLNQPHVRVFTEDREMSAWFLLDLSASLDFGSDLRRKKDLSRDFVAVLARMLTREGNRVGALLYGSGVDTRVPARSGRAQVMQLLHRLEHRPPHAGTATRLHELLDSAAHQLKRRATVFVVSDFISEPGWEKPLGQLARRHEVVVVRLLDPLELELPNLGLIPLRDAESGEVLMVDTGDKGFRQRFAQLAQARDAQFMNAVVHAGVDALELRTDDDLLDALVRFCALRKRRVQSQASGTARASVWPATAMGAAASTPLPINTQAA